MLPISLHVCSLLYIQQWKKLGLVTPWVLANFSRIIPVVREAYFLKSLTLNRYVRMRVLRTVSVALRLYMYHNDNAINTLYFYPRPDLTFGYCRCLRLSVRVCVNNELVRTITHHPFKLRSLNLDQRCKRPWVRSLLFCGVIYRDLQGHI